MASPALSSPPSPARGAIARHRILAAAAVLLLFNLGALVDKVLHPDIPYLDGEHLIVGGVTALCAAALYYALTRMTERTARLSQAEDALRESEERFRSVYENATLGLYRTTPDGRILLANPALVRMLGYASFADLAARNLEHSDAYEPDYSRADFLRRIDASGEVRGLESEWRRKDGTPLTVRENARAVRDASGRPLYFDGVVEDITERRREGEALTNSLALVESTLESTANGILVIGPEGAVLRANRRFAELWHIPGDVLASGDDGKLIAHVLEQLSDPDAFIAGVKALYAHPRAESADLLAFKDGRVFERTSRPMLVGGEPKARVWSFLDITERQEAEKAREALQAQLHQSQKADSLGRMAGAIAHNYNNILGAVLLNLELAQTKLPADSGARKNIAEATTASHRAAEISHLMLAYLGQGRGKREPVDLGDVCREALAQLPSDALANARLTTDFRTSGVIVRANAAQLKRVLTNLAENAGEAIEDGDGSVAVTIDVIAAADIRAARFYPADWQREAGTYACLSVADTGCGMAPEILDKAFDPFYSTKFTGRGLGLPVVIGIVQAHGGACAVESEFGRGTTFRVFLPLVAERPPQQRSAEPVASRAVEERGLLLVVEDEPMLRALAVSILQVMGYAVLEAADGAAAVEVFRQHQDQVRCVLCDVTMPGMDGWATLEALRTIRPGVAVILASGYDEVQVMAGEHAERPQAFLHKPYVSADLKAALSAALGER